MAYIGRGVEFGEFIKQTLTPNSSTTAFAMNHAASANSILVVYGNVVQEPGVGYTCAGSTITFTGTPVTGTSLYIIYMGRELTSVNATTPSQATTIAQDEAAALAIALG